MMAIVDKLRVFLLLAFLLLNGQFVEFVIATYVGFAEAIFKNAWLKFFLLWNRNNPQNSFRKKSIVRSFD
jgi:hypothetical protein